MMAIMTLDPISQLFAAAPRGRQPRGALVFHRGDPVENAIWLEAGSVALTRVGQNGSVVALHRAVGPCWLAEASLFSDAYHCDAEAMTDVVTRTLPKAKFLEQVSRSDARYALELVAHLSRELRDARARAERLTLKTVAERLDA